MKISLSIIYLSVILSFPSISKCQEKKEDIEFKKQIQHDVNLQRAKNLFESLNTKKYFNSAPKKIQTKENFYQIAVRFVVNKDHRIMDNSIGLVELDLISPEKDVLIESIELSLKIAEYNNSVDSLPNHKCIHPSNPILSS